MSNYKNIKPEHPDNLADLLKNSSIEITLSDGTTFQVHPYSGPVIRGVDIKNMRNQFGLNVQRLMANYIVLYEKFKLLNEKP